MSAREVADLLALAHQGFTEAASKNDVELKNKCVQLTTKALAHKDAPKFFGALSLALDESVDENEIFGNDPTTGDPGDSISDISDDIGPGEKNAPEADVDEDSPAASPAYEGLVNGDENDGGNNAEENEKENDKEEQAQASINAAVMNFRKFNGVQFRAK